MFYFSSEEGWTLLQSWFVSGYGRGSILMFLSFEYVMNKKGLEPVSVLPWGLSLPWLGGGSSLGAALGAGPA